MGHRLRPTRRWPPTSNPANWLTAPTAHDDLVLAPLEHASLEELEFVAHFERLLHDAAHRHIGFGAGRALGQADDHIQLGRGAGALLSAGDAGRVRDDARALVRQAAEHFAVRPAAQNDRGVGRAGGVEGLAETDAHREHAHQDGDHAADAEHRRPDRAASLGDAEQAELGDGGDLRKPVNDSPHGGLTSFGAHRPRAGA